MSMQTHVGYEASRALMYNGYATWADVYIV